MLDDEYPIFDENFFILISLYVICSREKTRLIFLFQLRVLSFCPIRRFMNPCFVGRNHIS